MHTSVHLPVSSSTGGVRQMLEIKTPGHSAYSELGSGVAPGYHLWQTLTVSRNPNVEPSSYRYTSTEWFCDIPTNFGLPPVRCSQRHKKYGYLDWLKWSGWYILLYKSIFQWVAFRQCARAAQFLGTDMSRQSPLQWTSWMRQVLVLFGKQDSRTSLTIFNDSCNRTTVTYVKNFRKYCDNHTATLKCTNCFFLLKMLFHSLVNWLCIASKQTCCTANHIQLTVSGQSSKCTKYE